MKLWYEIIPIDTLFFRGAEPLEAGQLVTTFIFPPPVSVILGTLRTAVIKQKKCSFSNYNNGNAGDEIEKLIGKSREKAPFDVTAIFLKNNDRIYAPTPITWFIDADYMPNKSSELNGKEVLVATTENKDPIEKLSVKSSSKALPLVKAEKEAISLGGTWSNINLFEKTNIVLSENDILTSNELFNVENRIGISLLDKETGKPTRSVQESALYSGSHIRLKDGITLIVAINKDIGLAKNGNLTLGGEQRISCYSEIQQPNLPKVGTKYVATAPIVADEIALSKVICAGKPVVLAGWDLAKGFHKPSQSLLPAGSVFSENINGQCLPLAR